MPIRLLLIGRSRTFISALATAKTNFELYIIEEADLLRKQSQDGFDSELIHGIKAASYQQSDALLEVAQQWHQKVGFDGVLATVEWGVVGANAVAQQLGLLGVGTICSDATTDKLKLRQLILKYNIKQPNFSEIHSPEDVIQFFCGQPIILKPANKQASAGVVKFEAGDDVEKVFSIMYNTDDGHKIAKRNMQWRYMVEDLIPGDEFSVETLISKGEIIFSNITAKTTTDGSFFVEKGHMVPADLKSIQENTILEAKKSLVGALAVENGFLHSEWIMSTDGPQLVECASRPAGDCILDLIGLAWGVNLYEAIALIYCGVTPTIPEKSQRAACICFFEPPVGTVKSIEGLETLKSQPVGLVTWKLNVKKGDRIHPMTSSWARVGYIITTGENQNMANRNADVIMGNIKFIIED
jgi:biotin carboxylase